MTSDSQNDLELDDLIAEWLELVERGENPDAETFIQRCPHRRDDFLGFIEAQKEVEAVRNAAANETTFIADASTLEAKASDVIGGRYKLLELIAQGGMGAVWLAEQREPVRRKVAIKVIKPGMDSQEILARFEAERQALALMEHENIARVFDGGMTESGRPYFAMEYVKGEPITEYCDRHQLSLDARLNLFIFVCRAVQHAHQKGIVHRDLKPSNILVCLFDGRPVPKVIDFGLAKAMNQPLTEKTLFTGHGIMVGTPKYMSPEQAENNNLDIDTRTDVYSLGVLLYELLTGTTPLTTEQLKAVALQEIIRLIKDVEPIRPSTRLTSSAALPSIAAQRNIEPHRLTKSLAGDLDWIALKALAKERERRYETASDLARDVERFLTDDTVEARPPSRMYQLRKFVRRNRGKVAAFTLVILSLVVGIITSTISTIEISRARKAESDSYTKYFEQVRKTNDQEQRALQQEAETRAARVGEATSRFYQLTETARRAIESHQAGWKSRAVDAISSAREFAQYARDGELRLRSLTAATNVGFDISEPLFTFDRRGLRDTVFHPSREWLIVSTARAYLPDPRCHIYVLDSRTGEVIHNIGLLNSIYPAFNGVAGLLLSRDGRWLYAMMSTASNESTVLVFDTAKFDESTTAVRRFDVPIRKLHQWVECHGTNTIVVSGVELGKNGEKFGDFKLLSINPDSGAYQQSLGLLEATMLIGTSDGTSVLTASLSSGVTRRESVTLSTTEASMAPGARSLALFKNTLARLDPEDLYVHSLHPFSWGLCRAQTPPSGLPRLEDRGELRFAPDGSYLLLGDTANKRIHLWDGCDFRYALDVGISSSDRMLRVQLSGDGKLIASSQGQAVAVREILRSGVKRYGTRSTYVTDSSYDDSTGAFAVLRPAQPDEHNSGSVEVYRNKSNWQTEEPSEVFDFPKVPWVPHRGRLITQHGGQVAALRSSSPNGSPHEATVSISVENQWRELKNVTKPDIVSFRPDGELVVGHERGTLTGISNESGDVIRQWRRLEDLATFGSSHYTTVTHVDDLLIITDDQGYCSVVNWSAKPPTHVNTFRISTAPVKAVTFNKLQKVLIAGDHDGVISVVDFMNSKVIHRYEKAHNGPIHALAYIDDNLFVTGGQDRRVAFWNLEPQRITPYFEFGVGTPVSKLFSAPSRDSVIMVRDRCVAFEEIPYKELLVLKSPES